MYSDVMRNGSKAILFPVLSSSLILFVSFRFRPLYPVKNHGINLIEVVRAPGTKINLFAPKNENVIPRLSSP